MTTTENTAAPLPGDPPAEPPAAPAADPSVAPAGPGPLVPPDGYDLVLRVAPMPADVNGNGDIFGGWVMAQVDIAGGIAAARRARGRVVTVAVNAFQFKQPVSVGDVVSFYARIVATGRTSITVHVEVISVRDPEDLKTVKVTEATLTYVAIERSGIKREVPPLTPLTPDTPAASNG